MLREVTRKERIKNFDWWADHMKRLKERGVITAEQLEYLRIHVATPEHFGYGQGEIRPGDLGKWDVFFLLEEYGVPYEKRLLLAGLSYPEVQKEMKRNEMSAMGYNPDDLNDVRKFNLLANMSSEDIGKQIKRLESALKI